MYVSVAEWLFCLPLNFVQCKCSNMTIHLHHHHLSVDSARVQVRPK